MGNISNIIDMMAIWEIIAIIFGLPIIGIGLFYLLKLEFRHKSAIGLSSFFTLLTLALAQNEIKIHYYLGTSNAETLLNESDLLWDYSKYVQSYEKLEQAIRVARYQRNNSALIAGYEKLTDRYFKQSSYQEYLQLTQWEIDLLEHSKKFLQNDYDKNNIDNNNENSQRFYHKLFKIDVIRNDPFENNIYYLSTDRLSPTYDQERIIRATYQRALIIIAQSIEAGDQFIPYELLGKFYSALSTIEESRNNIETACEYIQKSNYYWHDFRPQIQSARLAFKNGDHDKAHKIIEEIRDNYNAFGHSEENEFFVLEAASMELQQDHLSRAGQILNTLLNHINNDLASYHQELDKINFELKNNVAASNSNIYPSLRQIKSLRARKKVVTDQLSEINNRYSSNAYLKGLESKHLEIKQEYEKSYISIKDAIKFAELASNQKYLFKYHVRAAGILNKSGYYDKALNHLTFAKEVHDGENGIIINSKRENDFSRIYPEIFLSQIGLKQFEKAEDTLNNLYKIGRSREYDQEPNIELFEYYKGKVILFASKEEFLRADIYYNDAIDFLMKSAEQNEVVINPNISAESRFLNNLYETYLTELMQLRNSVFPNQSEHDFHKDRMLTH